MQMNKSVTFGVANRVLASKGRSRPHDFKIKNNAHISTLRYVKFRCPNS